ncbi:hypothetical protein AFB00_30270 (plasmid) [Pseudonocardia sp. HH130630-07]|nr:hypothetical protein AFB00_30270 [Pseudonocardia sp. HH130630-07]
MFACHQSGEGREQACAGWLAAVGADHLGARLAIAQGRLPAEALQPDPDGPALYGSWAELLAAKTPPGEPDVGW